MRSLGKATVWVMSIGFVLSFIPMYITGLDGQARRMYTYSECSWISTLNMVSFIGAGIMSVSFFMLVWNIWYSFKNSPRDIGSDPWDARGLRVGDTYANSSTITLQLLQTYLMQLQKHSGILKKNGMKLFKGEIRRYSHAK